MKKNKALKVFTLAGFIFLLTGFIAFKTKTFDSYMDSNRDKKDYESGQLANSSQMVVDTPPSKVVDTVRYNPAMMSTSKSVIVIDQKVKFPTAKPIKSDSTKELPKK